jgi:hypothetical protein
MPPERSEVMQNAKCKVQNYGVPSARLKIVGKTGPIIAHFALCILH